MDFDYYNTKSMNEKKKIIIFVAKSLYFKF